MGVPTLKDLLDEGVSGRGVLVRSDFNVPLDGDKITDPGRIIASLPTLNALIDAGAMELTLLGQNVNAWGGEDAGRTLGLDGLIRALDALPGRIEALPAYGDYARLLTVVALDYLDFRHGNMDWRRGRPELEALHAEWSQRPSMIETRPVGVAAE